MARFAVAAVAAIAVTYFSGGNVYAGAQTFALVYGATGFLDPNTKVKGPRLTDLKAPQASYGSPIPYLEGAPRLAGVIAWSSEKHEIRNRESSGKGGPGVTSTTYTYEIDLLIEVAINRCSAVRRVWSNGKLIWTDADDADDQTIRASQLTPAWRDLRFYDGNDDQLPDPTYEAAVGIGNAPAYRGRTTIFIEGLNLGNNGQLPVLTFEVLSEATTSLVDMLDAELEGVAPFNHGTPAFTDHGYQVAVGQWDLFYLNDIIHWYKVPADGGTPKLKLLQDLGTPSVTSNPIRGQSDVDCYVAWHPADPSIRFWVNDQIETGSWRDFSPAANESDSVRIFAKRGDTFITAHYTPYDLVHVQPKVLRIFDYDSTAHLHDTDDVGGNGFEDIAISIDESTAYALKKFSYQFFEFDIATGNEIQNFDTPLDVGDARILVDDDGSVYVIGYTAVHVNGALYKRNGTTWDFVSAGVGKTAPGSYYSQSGIANGVVYTMQGNTAGDHEVWKATWRSTIVLPMLDQVVKRLCLRTGLLTEDDIDVTALEDIPVRAMPISQVSSSRQAIETLMAAYLFEWVEGEKLVAVLRGGAPVLTIPFRDLGASSDGNADPFPKKRLNDMEIPARVSIKFANVLNDFQDGLESGERLVTDSTAVSVVEVPLGLTPTEAKRMADANTMDLATSLLQAGPFSLPHTYAALEPTDVVLATAKDGSLFRLRIVKGTISSSIYTFELVLDDATVINSTAATDSDYVATSLIRMLSETEWEPLDIPILRDADDGPGFYVAAKPSSEDGRWPGAELDKSIDDVTFGKAADLTSRAVMGSATSTLGDFTGGNVFDEVNTLTVDVGEGELSSVSRDVLLSTESNALLVGDEIVQFRSAALLSPGVYLLSGFLRGRRGTEHEIAEHVGNERVVLLTAGGLHRVEDQQADIGIPRFWKAITYGTSREDAESIAFTDTGVGLKPFSPVDLRVSKQGSALALTWQRRTRLSSSFTGAVGINVPLGEATEAYVVDVVASGNNLRTATVSAPAYTYDAAAQAADGVTSATVFRFDVYQLSAAVGRGFPGSIGSSGTRVAQPQIATVTVGGTFASGVELFVTLAGTRHTYTTVGGDINLAGVAASLAAAITGHTGYTIGAAGAVITIESPAGVAFTLNAGQVGGGPIVANVIQAAAPQSEGSSKQIQVFIQQAAGMPFLSTPGATYRLSFHSRYLQAYGRSIYYTHVGYDGEHASHIMNQLAYSTPTTSDGLPPGITLVETSGIILATFPVGELEWNGQAYNSGGANFAIGTVDPGSAVLPADVPQVTDFALYGFTGSPVAGHVYRITLGATDFDYTVVGGNSYAVVMTALSALIDADPLYLGTTVTVAGVPAEISTGVRVTAASSNLPFSYSGELIPGAVTLASSITQAAA